VFAKQLFSVLDPHGQLPLNKQTPTNLNKQEEQQEKYKSVPNINIPFRNNTTLQNTIPHHTTPHNTTLHHTTPHYTTLLNQHGFTYTTQQHHNTMLHNTTKHNTIPHPHNTAQHKHKHKHNIIPYNTANTTQHQTIQQTQHNII
jgi:hypothetical protein